MNKYPLKFRRSKRKVQPRLTTRRAFMSTVAAHLGGLWGTDKLAMSIATGSLDMASRVKGRRDSVNDSKMNKKPMKIAFSGPSGLGKSTLCRFVQEAVQIPWLSTSAGDIFSKNDVQLLREEYGYNQSGHKDVINLSATNPEFGLAFQKILLTRRVDQIYKHEAFVIDRCPIDNVAYLLSQVSHQVSEEDLKEFIMIAQQAYQELTHIIQIRYSPDIPAIEDNGSRIPNTYFQKYISDVFSGVFNRYFANQPGPRVITLDFWDLLERQRLVKAFLLPSEQQGA